MSNVVMFEFNVTVKVDLDNLPGEVEIDRNDVRDMIQNAISESIHEVAEAVTQCGDWNDTSEAIASTVPEFEVK